jgi:hypothetical protein
MKIALPPSLSIDKIEHNLNKIALQELKLAVDVTIVSNIATARERKNSLVSIITPRGLGGHS